MTTQSQSLRVGLLTTDSELATWFCEDLGCEPSEQFQTCTFSERQFSFQLANAEAVQDGGQGTVLQANGNYDVFVAIIRFVDVLSLQKMDQLLTDSGAGKFTPALILIYRNDNESDFKMSCPYCGQKLWVRDLDRDKRGRCPHCGKGFTLPEQEDHVSSSLRLPPSVEVCKIVRQDPGSFAGPLRKIIQLCSVENSLQNLGLDRGMSINDTMKVNVVDEGSE